MPEGFRPISNTPPLGFAGKLKFHGRMLLDLQINTIYKDVKNLLPDFKGEVLDIGCGQSPYRHLLNPSVTKYFGIDIVDASKFDYNNSDITPFDGETIPFEAEMFDGIICTEVLEHVQNYQKLVDEMYRVMKKGGRGIVTIPWSARYHYIPYDFFRYTPSALKTIFSKFSEVKIHPRGTDIVTIVSKIIVLWFRNLSPAQLWRWLLTPIWIALLPVLFVCTLIAHVSLLFGLGSDNDPLGYTIIIEK